MYIIGAQKIVNGRGDLTAISSYRELASQKGLKTTVFEIADATVNWDDPLPPNTFRSACACIEALESARTQLESGESDLVIIHGKDHLRSRYAGNTKLRKRDFEIYGQGRSPLTEYNKVTRSYLEHNSISKTDFLSAAENLFQNYLKTWTKFNDHAVQPDKKWFNFVTEYFRGVDCANPSLDFEGSIALTSKDNLNNFTQKESKISKVLAESVQSVPGDGPEYIDKIIPYPHLKKTFQKCLDRSKIDFKTLFKNRKALLEVYTCYPNVALAFLKETGFIETIEDLKDFLEQYEITVTGGLNLGKAAWNCTTLNNAIEMHRALHAEGVQYGGVHANGSLGNKQGFMIMEALPTSLD